MLPRAKRARPEEGAEDNEGETEEEIQAAATHGRLEELERLIESSSSPFRCNELGLTPLHLAARSGQLGVVEMLLARGHPRDPLTPSGFTPLHHAALADRPSAIVMLLRAGCDINARTQDGATALFLAASHGHVTSVRVLLAHTPDIYLSCNGLTAYEAACHNQHLVIAALLDTLSVARLHSMLPLPRPTLRILDSPSHPFPLFCQPGLEISPPPRIVMDHFSTPPGFALRATSAQFSLDNSVSSVKSCPQSVFTWLQLKISASSSLTFPKIGRFPKPVNATISFEPLCEPDCVLADIFSSVAPLVVEISLYEHVRWYPAPVVTLLSSSCALLYSRSETTVYGQWFISKAEEERHVGKLKVYILDSLGVETRVYDEQISSVSNYSFTFTHQWYASGIFWVIVRNEFVHRLNKTRISSSPYRTDQCRMTVVQNLEDRH